MVFYYDGKKYVNGFACDGRGRPITVKNGYSSEDERDARQDYDEALKNYLNQKSSQSGNSNNKYDKKLTIAQEVTPQLQELLQEKTTYFNNGYLLNEQGQEISLENGYSDEDARWAKQYAKENSKSFNF